MEISLPYHHSQNVLSGICPVIPACLWRESIPIGVISDIVYRASIPIAVMPDIFNRASILSSFRMDPRLQLAGMTEGEMDTRDTLRV
jgi:hypothetical protein